ncbi:unnamed protein product [Blepharisma stoltei]|uniref:Uncharacterized protein n=1 Tax=Blepharisma stoltei TaxID=1481888 RepID=A0AAU9J7W3_9CILI|nr:unnamed protein product [Blepharisma stoltei]
MCPAKNYAPSIDSVFRITSSFLINWARAPLWVQLAWTGTEEKSNSAASVSAIGWKFLEMEIILNSEKAKSSNLLALREKAFPNLLKNGFKLSCLWKSWAAEWFYFFKIFY